MHTDTRILVMLYLSRADFVETHVIENSKSNFCLGY